MRIVGLFILNHSGFIELHVRLFDLSFMTADDERIFVNRIRGYINLTECVGSYCSSQYFS